MKSKRNLLNRPQYFVRCLRIEFLESRQLMAGDLLVQPSPTAMRGEGEGSTIWVENAETGLDHVIANVDNSYSLIQSQLKAQGNSAFHLAHPNWQANSFEIDRDTQIENGIKLFFQSQLSFATASQVAKVQISTDGGATWPNLVYSQAGNGGAGDAAFTLHEIDLSSFAGQSIRIRFLYDLETLFAFTQTNPGTGWHVDDIQVGSDFQKSQFLIGEPTAQEQFFLELTNRARADAVAEGQRLSEQLDPNSNILPANVVRQFTEQSQSGFLTPHAQPLSFAPLLLQAARLHSQDMLQNNFQGHTSSSNPPAPFQSGFTPTQRVQALGYPNGVGENVFAFAQSTEQGHMAFDIDWGGDNPTSPDYNPAYAGQGMQNPAGHRRNIHNGDYREVGIGIVDGSNGSVGPHIVTQDYSSFGSAYVTGVVFDDINNNRFYDPGEGRSGVRIDVVGSAYFAISTASGGYSVPVSGDGNYQVKFSGGGFATHSTTVTGPSGLSVKADYDVVEAQNDPPQFVASTEVSVPESSENSVVLENWITDLSPGNPNKATEQQQSVSFQVVPIQVSNGLMDRLPQIAIVDAATWPRSAHLTLFPKADAYGSAIYDVIATDNDPAAQRSTTKRVTINIIPVNDAPIASGRTLLVSLRETRETEFQGLKFTAAELLTGARKELPAKPGQFASGTPSPFDESAQNLSVVSIVIPGAETIDASTLPIEPTTIDRPLQRGILSMKFAAGQFTEATYLPPANLGDADLLQVLASFEYVVADDGKIVWPDSGKLPTTVPSQRSATASVEIKLTRSPWQNIVNRLDVNDDGLISATDALPIINELSFTRTLRGPKNRPPYLDTNADFILSATDALLVINLLIARSQGEGESNGSPHQQPSTNSTVVNGVWPDYAWIDLLAMDIDNLSRKTRTR